MRGLWEAAGEGMVLHSLRGTHPAPGQGERLVKLGDLEFTAEDGVENPTFVRVISIERANQLLAERLGKAPEVKGQWMANAGGLGIICGDTHTARLVCIEDRETKK
jgi:hypothetical protein